MIYCCSCKQEVDAKLVSGDVVYPHRKDLSHLNFYQCQTCNNYVGVHKDSNAPLGCIPTPEIRELRKKIHAILDPIWQSGYMKRGQLYDKMSKRLGIKEYHTAAINSVFKAKMYLKEAEKFRDSLDKFKPFRRQHV